MNNEPVELSFFSDAIIRRWYLPVGLAVIGALIGLQVRPEIGETMYEAESRVLIRPVTDAVFDSNLRVDQIISSDTENQLASSEIVARSALELLGDEAPADLDLDDIADGLEVKVRADSQIVVIRYQHPDADVAGAVTDAIAQAYLNSRSQGATDEKERQANLLASQISNLTRDLTAANVTVATARAEADARESVEKRIDKLEEVLDIQALEGTEAEVVGDPIGVLELELAGLDSTVAPMQLAAAETSIELIQGQIAKLRDELIKLLTLEIDGGSVIQRAGVGDEVLPANPMIQPAIGALVGLMIGVAAAVMVERVVRSRAASSQGADSIPVSTLASAGTEAERTDPHSHSSPSVPPVASNGSHPEPLEPRPNPATWGRTTGESVSTLAPQQSRPLGATFDQPETFAAGTVESRGPAENTVFAIADIAKIPRSAMEPVVVTAPGSEPAAGLRTVARLIQNETSRIKTPSIMITSAKPHEGRTTVATNVAAALRQDGLGVLLISDAYDQVIAPEVHILPPGMQLGPDMEFPESARLEQLLAEARDLLDIVIIDAPPVLASSEALRLAGVVDAAVMVAVSGRTSASDVAEMKSSLATAGTNVLGLVTTARPSWLVRRIGDRTVTS